MQGVVETAQGDIDIDKAGTAARRADGRRVAVGLALWLAAIAAAYYAQNLLTPFGQRVATPPGKVIEGALWYGFAAVLAVAGVMLIERRAPLADQMAGLPAMASASLGWRSSARGSASGLVGAALVATGMTIYLQEGPRSYGLATLAWIIALLSMVAGVGFGRRDRWRLRWPQLDRERMIELGIVLAILALALLLRLPDLGHIPPDVHGDEAQVGLEARRILYGQVQNLFGTGWGGIPTMTFAVSAVFMRLFGDNLYGLRMASVLAGTLSVLLLYLVAKKLFSARVAVIAAFLLAVSQWHIHYSRDGLVNIQAAVAELLIFYFLLRGIENRRAVDFLLAGFAIGLSMNVYFAGRLGPALAGLYLLHKAITERSFLRQHWQGLLALALGTLVFLAPMAVYYTHNPGAFMARTEGAFLFSPRNIQHAMGSYRTERVEDALKMQAVNTLLAFNLRGETSNQYGHRAPLIDYWTSALFVLGVVVATLRPQRSRYFFVAVWFWLTLLAGSVLTVDAMFSPRLIGVVPVLFVFPALTIDAGWRGASELLRGRLRQAAFALPVAALLTLAALANYSSYFHVYVTREMPAGFFTSLSNYIASVNDHYRVYLIGKVETTLRHETPQFLLPSVDGVDVRNRPLALPLDRVPEAKGVVFIVDKGALDAAQRIAAIKETYPDGVEETVQMTNGVQILYSYRVEREQLLAANPDAQVARGPIPALSPEELEKRP